MAINDPMGGPNRLRRAAEPTARRSGTRAALFWVFALVAGLGHRAAARALSRQARRRRTGRRGRGVVVAAVDLPLAAKLKLEDLKVIEWPADHLPPGAISDPKELVGRVLISRVLAQQPLLPGMLAAKNAGSGLAALIPSNMRAIAVRVDDVVGVAGFIHADDRVDVLVTHAPERPRARESTTKVFLQNVKVLAVGQEVDNGDKSRLHATPATVATLLVSPQDAERLVLAQTRGRIMLTLRSWTDSLPVDTDRREPVGLGRRRRRSRVKDNGADAAAAHAQARVAPRQGRQGAAAGAAPCRRTGAAAEGHRRDSARRSLRTAQLQPRREAIVTPRRLVGAASIADIADASQPAALAAPRAPDQRRPPSASIARSAR